MTRLLHPCTLFFLREFFLLFLSPSSFLQSPPPSIYSMSERLNLSGRIVVNSPLFFFFLVGSSSAATLWKPSVLFTQSGLVVATEVVSRPTKSNRARETRREGGRRNHQSGKDGRKISFSAFFSRGREKFCFLLRLRCRRRRRRSRRRRRRRRRRRCPSLPPGIKEFDGKRWRRDEDGGRREEEEERECEGRGSSQPALENSLRHNIFFSLSLEHLFWGEGRVSESFFHFK